MRLCMRLNLGVEKQDYCLTSLNYVIQSYFPFPLWNRKTIFSKKKKKTYFLRLLSAFKKIFGFNNGQITEGEKQSSWGDESRMG